jgi:Protein of unknown function (DUF2631)
VAGDKPVTSPDQRKKTNPRLARFGGVVAIVILLAMLFPSQGDMSDDIWLIGIAALIALLLVGDWLLRRNGLRS